MISKSIVGTENRIKQKQARKITHEPSRICFVSPDLPINHDMSLHQD
jgi:hypothetical protein